MPLLSYDLTQSWGASSKQVPTVPESQFLKETKEGTERPPAVVPEWHTFKIKRNPGFPGNWYQVWTEIPVRKQAIYPPFTFIELLLWTVHLSMFVYLNPTVSFNLSESSFSKDFSSFHEEVKSSFDTCWKYYLSHLHSSYHSWILHLHSLGLTSISSNSCKNHESKGLSLTWVTSTVCNRHSV